MDMKLFKQHLARHQKINLTESVPNAIQKYKEAKRGEITFGIAYDAGSAVASHPAVREYLNHVSKTYPGGSREANQAHVRATLNLPDEVAQKVAKDFGMEPIQVHSAYRAYTSD